MFTTIWPQFANGAMTILVYITLFIVSGRECILNMRSLETVAFIFQVNSFMYCSRLYIYVHCSIVQFV